MPVVQVGSAVGFNNTASVSVSLTGVTAGNSILIYCPLYSDGTPADPSATGYTLARRASITNGSSSRAAALLYAHNVSAGTHNITVNTSAASGFQFGFAIPFEVSGLVNAAPNVTMPAANGANGANDAAPTTGTSGATTVANTFIVAGMCLAANTADAGIDVPATTGYTNHGVRQISTSETAYAFDSKSVTSTGTQSAAWGTLLASAEWAAVLVAFEENAGTPVGRADEADTALALSSPPTVGRANETDQAVALQGSNFAVDGDLFLFGDTADDESSMGGLRVFGGFVASGSSAPTGRADETDLALARAGVQIRAAGLAAETDTAFARAAVSIRAAGLSSETDAALQLAGVQLRAVGRADEIDAALMLGAGGTPVGLAAETDLALGLAPVAIRATGLAAETDTALARAALQIRVAGLAAETDTALGLTSGASGPVGVAAETDAAFGLTARQIGATGRADEADASLNLTAVSVRATGLGAETDAALALTPVQQGAAGRADEADTAFALLASGPQPVGLAVETDEAFALRPALVNVAEGHGAVDDKPGEEIPDWLQIDYGPNEELLRHQVRLQNERNFRAIFNIMAAAEIL